MGEAQYKKYDLADVVVCGGAHPNMAVKSKCGSMLVPIKCFNKGPAMACHISPSVVLKIPKTGITAATPNLMILFRISSILIN